MSNPIQYTSRTYTSILNDINDDAELRDKPDWWKRIWAGVGDVLSAYLNAQANNTYLSTAFTRQAVIDLTALLDYAMAPRSTSSGIVLFDMTAPYSFPVNIAVADLVAQTPGSISASAKRFEGRVAISIAADSSVIFTTNQAVDSELLTAAYDFLNTEKVRLSTTGTLPAGISTGTDYWVIRVSATTVKLATSRANALAGTAVSFSDDGSGTHRMAFRSIRVPMYQQSSVAQYSAGVADPTEQWQELELGDKNILRDTLIVTINSVQWDVLLVGANPTSFVFATSSDQYVQLVYNTDQSGRLRFGDGSYGEIPGGFDVFVEYAVGGGASANVSAGAISIYAGGDAEVESVYNPVAMTGGSEAESMESAKVIAPLLLKARDRFVATEDGEALALAFGGLSQVKVNKNVYGVLSAQVLGVANGGGNPSSGTKTALQAYLIDRTMLEGIDVRVEDATITAQAVTSAAKMNDGYTYATVEPYIEAAWQLFFSETGKEIQDAYESSDIATAVTLFNSIFGSAFGPADYAQLEVLIANLEPRQFGDTIQESDALGYLDTYVAGIDFLTVTVPTFPVALDDDEITTDGALTLTEIP